MNNNKIDKFFTNFNSCSPGMAVLVRKKSKAIYQKCFGMANLAKQIPITPETNFRLASLTKPFTAMAITFLKDKNQLNYEDCLNKFFPDFPKYGKITTIKQLLTHTAGFPDHEQILYQTIKNGYLPSINDALEVFKQGQPLFKPGSRYQYSDAGYVMLALIIEKVSGQKYSNYLKTNILKPLGMKTTLVIDNPKIEIPNRAFGYLKDENSWTLYDFDQLNYIIGDEGIYSSLNDLSLLKPTNSLGWLTPKIDGKTVLYHDGFWLGFRNFMLYLPKDNVSIILLSNNTEWNSDQKRWRLAKKLLKMVK